MKYQYSLMKRDFAWEQVNNFTPEKREHFANFIDRYRVSERAGQTPQVVLFSGENKILEGEETSTKP